MTPAEAQRRVKHHLGGWSYIEMVAGDPAAAPPTADIYRVFDVQPRHVPVLRGIGATFEAALEAAGVGEVPEGPPVQLDPGAWASQAMAKCKHPEVEGRDVMRPCVTCVRDVVRLAIERQKAVDDQAIRDLVLKLGGGAADASAALQHIRPPESTVPVNTDTDPDPEDLNGARVEGST